MLSYNVRSVEMHQGSLMLYLLAWLGVKGFPAPESLHVMHTVPTSVDLLHKQMQNWWRTDSFGTKYQQTSPRSLVDKKALKILKDPVKHVGDRHEAGMLWRRPDVDLPDNRAMTERCLRSTEKALKRDDTLAKKYNEIIDGYMTKRACA